MVRSSQARGVEAIVLALLMLAASAPVWESTHGWSDEHDQNYAHFVQTLFAGDGDLSWPHLHALLRDRERNLLFDHLGQDEDNRLTLRPDCGDLAYVLRAYFAWKHELGSPLVETDSVYGGPGFKRFVRSPRTVLHSPTPIFARRVALFR